MVELFLLLLIFKGAQGSTQQWTTSNVLLPRPADGMAVGSYDDSIYLLGSSDYKYQLIRYDIIAKKVVDFGKNNLTAPIFGTGQFYSVTNNIMYMIYDTGTRLSIFDLKTTTFTRYWRDINIPFAVGVGSCILSTNAFLYIVGGDGNKLLMLAFEHYQWIQHPPSMHASRTALTCNIHPPDSMNYTIYAIGGFDQSEQSLDSVEYINTNGNDIHNQFWRGMNYHLLYPTESARSVVYKSSIFVIGGQYWDIHRNRYDYINTIQIIDMKTGKISEGDALANTVENTAAIIVNNVIYAFGGFYFNPIDQWQYFNLIPTNTPTSSPTNTPTNAPSSPPSRNPTKPPSRSPTEAPSLSPTDSPSQHPTFAPSTSPSVTPTSPPSISPSKTPTNIPSHNPTQIPSLSPSITPSNTPTNAPTSPPSIAPTNTPTNTPTHLPSIAPSHSPTQIPSLSPSINPTMSPTHMPGQHPTFTPSLSPSLTPTSSPSVSPTHTPILYSAVDMAINMFIIGCLTFLSLIISIRLTHQLLKTDGSVSKNISKILIISCIWVSTMCNCFDWIRHGICLFLNINLYSYPLDSIMGFADFLFFFGQVLFFLISISRIQISFISIHCYILSFFYLLIATSFILSVYYCIMIVFMEYNQVYDQLYFLCAMGSIEIILNAFLLFLFILKLKQLLSARLLHFGGNKLIKTSHFVNNLVLLITRHTILFSFAVIINQIWYIVIILNKSKQIDISYSMHLTDFVWRDLSNTSNCVLLFLSLQSNLNIYKKVCGRVHGCIYKCFLPKLDHKFSANLHYSSSKNDESKCHSNSIFPWALLSDSDNTYMDSTSSIENTPMFIQNVLITPADSSASAFMDI